MRSAMRVLALTAIGAAAFVPAAHAQDMTTATLQRHHHLGGRRLSVFDASRHQVHRQGQGQRRISDSAPTSTRRTAISANMAAARRRRHRDGAWLLGRLARHRRRQGIFDLTSRTDDRRPASSNGRSCSVLRSGRRACGFGSADRLDQTEPRCRLLGRPGRVQIRRPGSPCRVKPQFLPQRLFHRRRRCSRNRPGHQDVNHGTSSDRATRSSPTRKRSIPPMTAAISASAANTASASSRA